MSPLDYTGENPQDLTGESELPSPGFEPLNLLELGFRIESCTDPDLAAYNGYQVTGYAWLDRTRGEKDTLVAVAAVEAAGGHAAAFVRRYRRQ